VNKKKKGQLFFSSNGNDRFAEGERATRLMQNGQDRGDRAIHPPLLVGEGLGVRFVLLIFTKLTPHPYPSPYRGRGFFLFSTTVGFAFLACAGFVDY